MLLLLGLFTIVLLSSDLDAVCPGVGECKTKGCFCSTQRLCCSGLVCRRKDRKDQCLPPEKDNEEDEPTFKDDLANEALKLLKEEW